MVAPVGFVNEYLIGSRRGYPFGERERFGTGVDGAYSQVGGAVSFNGEKHFTSVSISTSAVYGPTDVRGGCLYCSETLQVINTSSLESDWRIGSVGGAGRINVGNGNNGVNVAYADVSSFEGHAKNIAGYGGRGGAGGGANPRTGGNSGYTFRTDAVFESGYPSRSVGGTGVGTAGINSGPVPNHADYNYFDIAAPWVGFPGSPGGGGAIQTVGSGSPPASGEGAASGQAGGYLHIRAKNIIIDAGSFVTVSGSSGNNGGNAADSGGADSNCGGGGAGGGGGGGLARILCETITGTARIRSTGGFGGNGGTGVGTGSAGGNAGDGAGGIIALSATISQAA